MIWLLVEAWVSATSMSKVLRSSVGVGAGEMVGMGEKI